MIDLTSLRQVVGAERLLSDPESRQRYSVDITDIAQHHAAAIVRPANAEMTQAIVAWAKEHNVAVIARGGGMSYTSGYVPQRPDSIILDMRDLNVIRAINPTNATVTVEAGCTWESLYQTLASQNLHLRTPFFGPLSGIAATIGGTIALNGAFFGSAKYGFACDQVLGLELVDGCGELRQFGLIGQYLATGSFGPDLIKALVADAGIFGIKTALTLPLIKTPAFTEFSSFAFDLSQQLFAALEALNDVPNLAEVYAFDRQTHVNLSRSGFSVLEATSIAADLVTQTQSLLKTTGKLLAAARLQRTRLKDLNWSLHIVAESPTEALAQAIQEAVSTICCQHDGQPIPDTIPRVTRARPFRPIKALFGPDGERWLPCHGVFPITAANSVFAELERWLQDNNQRLEQHSIRIATLLARASRYLIIEPQFFWSDSLSTFQRAWGQEQQVRAFNGAIANPEAREQVLQMRAEIKTLFGQLGGGHLQIGKYYPWLSAQEPSASALMTALKQQMDPAGILNPGGMGL